MMNTEVYDADAAYRRTQSQIYGLQETLLNSTKLAESAKRDPGDNEAAEEVDKRELEAELTSRIESEGAPQGTIEIDSKPVLTYVLEKYGCLPNQHERIDTLMYHPYREGTSTAAIQESNPRFLYDSIELSMPRPFLPGYGLDKINKLVTVQVSYEDLKNSIEHLNSPRALNNELWGCQIYTDDSDPVLVLRHCGVSIDENNGYCRTPANLRNTDNIVGTIPPKGALFDLEVDLLLLPTLQKYESVRQYGLRSRVWGGQGQAAHDGISYGIHSIRITTRDTSTQNINAEDHKIVPSSQWKDLR